MAHRHEYKYLVSEDLLPDLRALIQPFVELDPFAAAGVNHEYTVRSVYFDTPAMREYHEKIEGLSQRKKVRLRVYNRPTSDSISFFEIKRKNQHFVSKQRIPLAFKDVAAFLSSDEAEPYIQAANGFSRAIEDSKTLFYYLRKDRMHPVVLVTYEREAFLGKFDQKVRITLDKKLRVKGANSTAWILREDGTIRILPRSFILEVKFQDVMPVWIDYVIAEFHLHRQALSKYCMGIDAVNAETETSASRTLSRRNFSELIVTI